MPLVETDFARDIARLAGDPDGALVVPAELRELGEIDAGAETPYAPIRLDFYRDADSPFETCSRIIEPLEFHEQATAVAEAPGDERAVTDLLRDRLGFLVAAESFLETVEAPECVRLVAKSLDEGPFVPQLPRDSFGFLVAGERMIPLLA